MVPHGLEIDGSRLCQNLAVHTKMSHGDIFMQENVVIKMAKRNISTQSWHLSMIYFSANERLIFHGFVKVNTVFFIYTRTQTLRADRKYVAMSVFICTLLNRPKFSVFALSLWLEFIRAAFVVIFSPNPFNIIILLTGINCLHISTLDIFWLKLDGRV